MGKREKNGRSRRHLLTAVLLVTVMLWFFTAIGDLDRRGAEEGRAQLESALRRSAVACYAAEGFYPPTLDYLTAHYGVQIPDEYIVFYEIFSSNLMPDITVLEKGV